MCGKNEPANPTLTYEDIYDPPCSDSSILAYNSGTEIYNAYKDSLDQSFNSKYAAKCLSAASLESFTVLHPVSEYHYTLYYYDQAGNLVKTIPPAGVQPNRNEAWLNDVELKRKQGLQKLPDHSLPTVYRYNSLNQVVSQQTPDAGKSTNWYDRLGRLAVSQNAQQLIDGKYSYTVYDPLGRITEVGQKPQPTAMTNAISRDPQLLFNWIYYNNAGNTYGAEMVTRTVYDVPGIDGTPCVEALRFTQKPYTLRNRVSYTRYFEKPSYSYDAQQDKYFITGLSYTSGIDYSYDIHGNVDTMRNLYGSNAYSPMTYHGTNACKTIAYHYDLISGKVNQVHYNPGQNDEFYHRYEYDAENRLTDVYTTDNKMFLYQQGLEEHEARYSYYKHGPLARTVLGQQQVQGVDYVYNLQGWLKGINGNGSEAPSFDAGGDAMLETSNQYVASDAYGITLRHFTGDYTAINGNAPNLFPAYENRLGAGKYKPLYNGNISAMTAGTARFTTQLYNYHYDQLNRLVTVDAYDGIHNAGDNWNNMQATVLYKERFTYDANGNILKVVRNGHPSFSPLLMDDLKYHYIPGTNRLEYVDDHAAVAYGVNLIRDQTPGNYKYDAIGNQVSNAEEYLQYIKWNVYGKMEEIQKFLGGNVTTHFIHYNYDPSGNRIGQAARRYSGAPLHRYSWYVRWYVRDAQGNVLAVYKVNDAPSATQGSLQLAEHHMYGSSRLGIINRELNVDQPKHTADNSNNNLGNAYFVTFKRGKKLFELTNHLGNVMVTISDRKLGIDDNSNGTIDFYKAEVLSAQDYYAFGMEMPGRQYSNMGSKYRYGFNGKEEDTETGWQDYGFRIYDNRLARFFSVDPLTSKYPELTPYQFASNRPIDGIDLDGLEFFKVDNTSYRIEYQTVTEAKNILDGANRATYNIFAFVWNGTFGAVGEGGKALNNYFAGGYKERATTPMEAFDAANHYFAETPSKQLWRDFKQTATDPATYEAPVQLIISHKLSGPSPIQSSTLTGDALMAAKAKVFEAGGSINILGGAGELNINSITRRLTGEMSINNKTVFFEGSVGTENGVLSIKDVGIRNKAGNYSNTNLVGEIGFEPFKNLIDELKQLREKGGYKEGKLEFERMRPEGSKLPDSEKRTISF